MDAKSVTVSGRSGDVTISVQGDASPAGQPIVRASVAISVMAYPVQMSLTDARRLARNIIDAANDAQQIADGLKQMASTVAGA